MRHNKDDKRFGRNSGHLRCMMANMTSDLLNHERIKTTTPKAKELRRYAERMITLGKKGSLNDRRRAFAFLRSKTIVHKLFTDIAPRFSDRPGGYTRILKMGLRPGDASPMSIIELVGEPEAIVTEEPKKKKAAPKKDAKDDKAKDDKKPAAKKAAAPKKDDAKATEKPAAKKAAPKKDDDDTKKADKKPAAKKKDEEKADK